MIFSTPLRRLTDMSCCHAIFTIRSREASSLAALAAELDLDAAVPKMASEVDRSITH